jgi:hypothetical protein
MFQDGAAIESAARDDVARFQQSVAEWRRSRTGRPRMPERLWSRAVSLARAHGLHRVARAGRLDYYSLKRRMTSAGPNGPPPPSFVEVAVAPAIGTSDAVAAAVVEVEGHGRVRLRLQSVTSAGLVALCEALWRARSQA